MPIYYFDVVEDDRLVTDEDGTELRDLYEAREQAEALLPNMARDKVRDGQKRDFTVIVKCPEKRIRLQTTLSVRSVWIEPPDHPQPA